MNALRQIAHPSVGLTLLKEFIETEQLTRTNFSQLDELLAITAYEYRQGNISKEKLAEINTSFGRDFLENTLHGLGFLKPNGYPGDYLFLDRVYTNHISTHPQYAIWDEYVQQNGAPDAVRNRKEYFKHLVRSKAKSASRINVLNIISGSGRELAELYETMPTKSLHTTCVEIDAKAIAFSKELNKNHLEGITYTNSNIYRYQPEDSFDVIWSAGLFDYLNDKAFVKLLRRFANWQKKGGEIVIGNYNEAHNPSRDYMEILGDWHLIYRTESQLIQLATEAGFGEHQIRVSRMPDNMILYLHLQT